MQTPFTYRLSTAKATLYTGDAVDFLQNIPKQSVDLIVTSPPYFIGKAYDTSRNLADFAKEIRRVTPAMLRCLKPGGSLCWQVGNHVQDGCVFPLDFAVAAEMQRKPSLTLRNRIIWTFRHGAHTSRRFSGRHETILWYTKGDTFYFDLDALRVPQIYPGKRHYKGPKKGSWSGNPLGKNPGDVWEIGDVWSIPNVKANHVEKTPHPCQFPTALVRRLVAGLCPQGGLVIDPYVGSGTSAIAALLQGCNFSGCDRSEAYIEIARSRLDALESGSLRFREDTPPQSPTGRESVATKPPHFRGSLEVVNG